MNQDRISMAQALILAITVAVITALVVVTFMPRTTQVIAGSSPAGTSFNTAKVAAINLVPSSSAASSTSILNTDAQPRIITDSFASCQGANGQGGSFQAATTSLSSLGFGGNTNYIASSTATTTTASSNFYIASSTEGVIPFTSRVWPSGTYLTFDAVSNSYNGLLLSNCTVGVHYLAS